MIEIKKDEINGMDKIFRLNLINSITGFKPANLIGSASKDGKSNLAIISSAVHLGSNPAILGFVFRPAVVPRHSYSNIKDTGKFTLNHVHKNFADKAHYTSAKFPEGVSEFEACGLTEEYISGFNAPFVKESQLKIALSFLEETEIKANGIILVVGQVESLFFPKEILQESGELDLNAINDVCISGLNNYHEAAQFAAFGYARPGNKPENTFKK